MAAIDKIYGSPHQYDQLKEWLEENKPEYLKYLYEKPTVRCGPLSNFSTEADVWLYDNCPLDFVKETITFQYNGSPKKDHENEQENSDG